MNRVQGRQRFPGNNCLLATMPEAVRRRLNAIVLWSLWLCNGYRFGALAALRTPGIKPARSRRG